MNIRLSRLRILIVALSLLAVAAMNEGRADAHVVPGRLAVLYPVSGNITTLECYDGPSFAPCVYGDPNGDGVTGPHAGSWASRIDVGNVTNQTTWIQIDYLPDGGVTGVSGGYAIAYKLSTYCSNFEPGQTYYNGKLIQVDILYYDTSASYINGHSLLFQHVVPNYRVGESANVALWYHWNNANNSVKLWPSYAQDFTFDSLALGGMDVSTVANFTPGSPPASCAGAPHLHMENSIGEYNPNDYLGKTVSAEYHDAQYMHLPGITGTAPY